MPESVDQTLLPPPESSPMSRVINRIKDAVHAHTPEGRRQEYLAKWSHVLEETKGLPRFELERRLNSEAGKYARDRVIRDVVVVTALTGGAVAGTLGLRELSKRNWDLKGLFQALGANIRNRTESVVGMTAEVVVTGAMKGVGKTFEQNPNLVTDLAERAAEQAMNGIKKN